MESFLLGSCPNSASSIITNGACIWGSKHRTNKNIYYASSYARKASQQERKNTKEYNILRFQHSNFNSHYKSIEGVATYQECNRKYVAKATSEPSFQHELHSSSAKSILNYVKDFLDALYMFSTPYAMIGRTISTISACLIAVNKLSDISLLFVTGMLQVMIPFLFMDIYISGINQLFDVEIDKINKPYLPLVSGKLSITSGVVITVSCLIMSFWSAWIIGSWPVIWSLLLCSTLWTAYSANVPLLRWKRNPVLAAMCIIIPWAFVFPITYFFHIQTFLFRRPTIFPRSLIFVIVFMSFYSIGIALFKDLPDVEGDKKHGISTFATRFGKKRVFWFCVSFFEIAFGVALMVGATSSSMWSKIATGLGNVVLASILWNNAKYVDLTSRTSLASFYMLAWKLLFGEYFLMPLVR